MHHGFANGLKPIETLEGIFVGLQANGETAMVVAKLEYPKPRSGLRAPPVAFTIEVAPPPSDFTSVRPATELPDADNKLIISEISEDPKFFSPTIPERLVDLTIQHYSICSWSY
jgi:hypothetical protein